MDGVFGPYYTRSVRTFVAALVTACFAVGSGVSTAASGLPDRASWQQYGPQKVQVCHRTTSRARPYATLTIARVVLASYLRRGATVGPCVYGSVAAGGGVSLRTWSGRPIATLEAQRLYSIVIKDSSRADNFHLRGPGIDRRTGQAYRGTVRWKVSLRPGRYRYRSDSHPLRQRTFIARTRGSA